MRQTERIANHRKSLRFLLHLLLSKCVHLRIRCRTLVSKSILIRRLLLHLLVGIKIRWMIKVLVWSLLHLGLLRTMEKIIIWGWQRVCRNLRSSDIIVFILRPRCLITDHRRILRWIILIIIIIIIDILWVGAIVILIHISRVYLLGPRRRGIRLFLHKVTGIKWGVRISRDIILDRLLVIATFIFNLFYLAFINKISVERLWHRIQSFWCPHIVILIIIWSGWLGIQIGSTTGIWKIWGMVVRVKLIRGQRGINSGLRCIVVNRHW